MFTANNIANAKKPNFRSDSGEQMK